MAGAGEAGWDAERLLPEGACGGEGGADAVGAVVALGGWVVDVGGDAVVAVFGEGDAAGDDDFAADGGAGFEDDGVCVCHVGGALASGGFGDGEGEPWAAVGAAHDDVCAGAVDDGDGGFDAFVGEVGFFIEADAGLKLGVQGLTGEQCGEQAEQEQADGSGAGADHEW